MLVDAAKGGDVEIPIFCYEPKLGAPVGACRMCLVEVEGIPKLQTACSTPVRDGMVVYTQTDRVQEAQRGRRVPPRQPSARLPGVRQGGRVPAAGHRDGLGSRAQPGRSQAALQAGAALTPGPDRPASAASSATAACASAGDRRGRAAAAPPARRGVLRWHSTPRPTSPRSAETSSSSAQSAH